MKKIKDMFGSSNYKVVGLKGQDHCTCFDEHCWGILKNGLAVKNKDVKGYHYSLNTVSKCERYLINFFNKKFGAGDWDRKHHPEYLYFIYQRKQGIKAWGKNANFFYERPELNAWVKTLTFHQKAIVIGYGLLING